MDPKFGNNGMRDQRRVASSTEDDTTAVMLHRASSATLIAACLDGDDRAWSILITRCSLLIFDIPLRFGFTEALAEEIFQETCLILLEKLPTVAQQDRLSDWLVTVTHRACMQRLEPYEQAKLNIEAWEASLIAGDPPIENSLIQKELEHDIGLALQRLSPQCRELVEALFLRDPAPTYGEIARELGIPRGSIGPYRARCLKELRLIITKLGLQ